MLYPFEHKKYESYVNTANLELNGVAIVYIFCFRHMQIFLLQLKFCCSQKLLK